MELYCRYESVIRALEISIHCSTAQAMKVSIYLRHGFLIFDPSFRTPWKFRKNLRNLNLTSNLNSLHEKVDVIPKFVIFRKNMKL